MIIDFIIEDLMLNSYLQKNFHTLDFFTRFFNADSLAVSNFIENISD